MKLPITINITLAVAHSINYQHNHQVKSIAPLHSASSIRSPFTRRDGSRLTSIPCSNQLNHCTYLCKMTTEEEEITIQTILPPLLLSLSIWTTCYYISVLSPTGKPTGFESIWISNLHTLTLVTMASLSLMEVIPEYIPSCWSTSFFLVDTLDCIWRRDVMWGFHGIISLVLNVCTASHGVHRRLRSASKGFFTEASTVCLFFGCCGERIALWSDFFY